MAAYPNFSLHYKEQISSVSRESLGMIRRLDVASLALSSVLDEEIELEAADRASRKKRRVTGRVLDICKLRQANDVISSRKVDLAMQLYDFLDLNVKLIDNELSVLEQSIAARGMDTASTDSAHPVKSESTSTASHLGYDPTTGAPLKRKRGRPRLHPLPEPAAAEEEVVPEPTVTTHENEPVYCICKRIAFGEMIACDNEDCPVEWFHYPCVNLTRPPRNTWICPICSARKKK